jgi:hypothetical protein
MYGQYGQHRVGLRVGQNTQIGCTATVEVVAVRLGP